MNKLFNTLLRISLFGFLTSGIIGFYYLSIEHDVYAFTWAKIGGVFSLLFTAIVIGEVIASKNAKFYTKLIWVISFLLFEILAGIAYYLVDRKTINQRMELN